MQKKEMGIIPVNHDLQTTVSCFSFLALCLQEQQKKIKKKKREKIILSHSCSGQNPLVVFDSVFG